MKKILFKFYLTTKEFSFIYVKELNVLWCMKFQCYTFIKRIMSSVLLDTERIVNEYALNFRLIIKALF